MYYITTGLTLSRKTSNRARTPTTISGSQMRKLVVARRTNLKCNYSINQKDRWDSRKPRRQQILFCDIQIKVVISRRQYYVQYIPSRSASFRSKSE